MADSGGGIVQSLEKSGALLILLPMQLLFFSRRVACRRLVPRHVADASADECTSLVGVQ